jgi:hypothetical protein
MQEPACDFWINAHSSLHALGRNGACFSCLSADRRTSRAVARIKIPKTWASGMVRLSVSLRIKRVSNYILFMRNGSSLQEHAGFGGSRESRRWEPSQLFRVRAGDGDITIAVSVLKDTIFR